MAHISADHSTDKLNSNQGQDDQFSQMNLEFEALVLESHEFTLQDLETMDNYQQRRYPDAIYIGQITTGKRNGKGVMRYKNGR